MIKYGTGSIGKIMYGTTVISRVMYGSDLVWENIKWVWLADLVYDENNIATEFSVDTERIVAYKHNYSANATHTESLTFNTIGSDSAHKQFETVGSLKNIATYINQVDTLYTWEHIKSGDIVQIVKEDGSINEFIPEDDSSKFGYDPDETWVTPVVDYANDITHYFSVFEIWGDITLRVWGEITSGEGYLYVYDENNSQVASLDGTFDNTYTISGLSCSVRVVTDADSTYSTQANFTCDSYAWGLECPDVSQGEIITEAYLIRPQLSFDDGTGFIDASISSNSYQTTRYNPVSNPDPFGDNSLIYAHNFDDAGNSYVGDNPIYISGNIDFVPAKFGNGAYASGESGFIDLEPFELGYRTLSFWTNAPLTSTVNKLLCDAGDNDGSYISTGDADGSTDATFGIMGSYGYLYIRAVFDNTDFKHIAITSDDSHNLSVFINGVEKLTYFTGSHNNDYILSLMTSIFNGPNTVPGTIIDQYMSFRRELSVEDINILYEGEKSFEVVTKYNPLSLSDTDSITTKVSLLSTSDTISKITASLLN